MNTIEYSVHTNHKIYIEVEPFIKPFYSRTIILASIELIFLLKIDMNSKKIVFITINYKFPPKAWFACFLVPESALGEVIHHS